MSTPDVQSNEQKKKRVRSSGCLESCVSVKVHSCRTDIVYSQPADTGTGTLSNTQLVYAVDFLRVFVCLWVFAYLMLETVQREWQPNATGRRSHSYQHPSTIDR